MRVIKLFHLDQPTWKNSSVPYFPFCLSGCHPEGACSRLSDPVPPCTQWSHTYHIHTKPTSEAVFQLLTELLSDSQLSRAESMGPPEGLLLHAWPATRVANCPSPVCFMGISQPRKNSSKTSIQPQGYSKEGGPNLRVGRLLMTTRNISTERQRKLNWHFFSYWTPHLVNVLASPPWHRLLAELLSTCLVNGNC